MRDRVGVKICGLTRREDVEMAASLGADYVGVVLTAGFGRSVAVAAAPALVRDVSATPVAVLVDELLESAAGAADALGAGVVQLHGQESPDLARELRSMGPWDVWKAVRVRSAADLCAAVDAYAPVVDGILVEGWKEGVVGGGGVKADLTVLESARAAVPRGVTLVLAGGLTPENVAEGVARVRPSVVDVSSGVEEGPGRKSRTLVQRLIEEARRSAPPPHGAPS
jgi:phosphoribosylanthranilate isomerase